MSDTSIAYRSSYDNDPDSYPNKKGNCWNRIGANICVGILILITIILTIALVYMFYQRNQIERIQKMKAQGKSKSNAAGAAEAGGFFSNVFSGSKDDGNTDQYEEAYEE